MSYYQGDYYQGDYYQGDPFLGTLIGMGASWLGKKLLKKGASQALVASTGAGALVGGATGVAAGGIGGALVARGTQSLWQKFTDPPPYMALGRGSQYQPPTFNVTGPRSATGTMMGAGGACACPSGFHPNKTQTKMGHPPGTTCVKNRSMNVANPRALRRSLRRVAGFGKLASRARKTVNATARAMK